MSTSNTSNSECRDGDDPLHLEEADRAIRINRLREEIKRLGGESVIVEESENCPPEIIEQFLENVLEIERAPMTTHLELLRRQGLELPPADTLSEGALREKLWELFRVLEKINTYVHRTNHLSDRELYKKLREESLPESAFAFAGCPDSYCGLDLLGGGSDEDIHLGMKYYATEEERVRWMKSFPDYAMPSHEDPPYDRDRFLPRRGWPWD
jgi:hypothetical protein